MIKTIFLSSASSVLVDPISATSFKPSLANNPLPQNLFTKYKEKRNIKFDSIKIINKLKMMFTQFQLYALLQ